MQAGAVLAMNPCTAKHLRQARAARAYLTIQSRALACECHVRTN